MRFVPIDQTEAAESTPLRFVPLEAERQEPAAPDTGDETARLAARYPKKEERPERTLGGTMRDIGVTALKGAVGLPQAIVGLADIPTGGRVGRALESAGFRPGDAQKMLDKEFSPAQQAARQEVENAQGFVGTAKAMLENPSTIAVATGESLPQMLGGAGVARGVMAAAPKVAPWIAGAVGEGVIGAGSAASQIREQSEDGLLTAKQSAAALGSGAGTAVFGAAGGKLAQRAGLPDVDTMLASGKLAQSPVGFAKAVVGSGISEGVFEEMPQSAQEQMWQNWATDRPLLEGVDKAAAQGLVTGAAMGAGAGGTSAISGTLRKPADRTPQIKALREQGDETAAAILEQRQQKEQAAYTAERETQAVAQINPELAQRYRDVRMAGAKSGDAVVQTAARWNFEQAAKVAGLTPKAQEAISAKLSELPPEKVAGFVQKAITGLVNAGVAQPFEGMDQIAANIETQRDQMLDAVLSGAIAPTTPTEAADATQDPAQGTPEAATAVDALATPEAGAGADAVLGGAEQADPAALSEDWQQFPQETETLGVPRAEMPQVKTVHRGPLVNFLNARGVAHEQVEVDPATLKPTQAEFSQTKVQEAADRDTDRSILISSDGHIIDGHHQAIAKLQNGKPVRAIRLDAPAADLLPLVREFPSSTVDQASDVQDAPQATIGAPATTEAPTTGAETPAVEAPAPAGGDAAAAAGLPAAPGAGDVQADGVADEVDSIADLPGVEPGDRLEMFGPRGLKGNSWVLREKATGRAIEETRNPAKVRKLNTEKYEAVPIGRHLADLNDPTTPAYASARDLSKNPQELNTSAEPAQKTAKSEQVEMLGRNSQPISEGGTPFKTRAAAAKEKKLHPTMRVVQSKDGKGYVLKPMSAKQIAAAEKAAKRIKGVATGQTGPQSLHHFILSEGGLAFESMADAGFDKNQRIGNRWLFSKTGKTLAKMAEALKEAGFITEETENAVSEGLRRSLVNPIYTPEGYEAMAQAEAQTRYEDHLAAQQEEDQAADENAEDFDPFASPATMTDDGFGPDIEAEAGYDALERQQQAEVDALLAAAEAEGIDVEAIREQAFENTQGGTNDDYRNETRALIAAARSERAQAAERARSEQGRQDAERESGGRGREDDGDQGAARSKAATLTDRPDGTLAVKGDTAVIKDRLTTAGIPAKSILPSATGVVVGKTQAAKAREVLTAESTKPATVPPAVADSVKWALARLKDVEFALEGVQRARGRGHMLALEWQDQQEKIAPARKKLDEFKRLAASNGVDADAFIKEMGGEPDLERFNVATVKADPKPATPKAPVKVTPQIPSSRQLADMIQIAADSIDKLRKPDVDRVLNEAPANFRTYLAMHIREKRPDLADEARDVMEELNAAPTLTAPTKADIEAQQARTEQAAKDKAAADRAADRTAAQDDERKRIAKASEQAADTFELGGDAMANLTGQKDIFGEAQPVTEPASKPQAQRLTDAGEELIRNRRGKLKGLAWADVSDMNDTLKVAQVVKANVWPRPDYAKMVEDGAPAWKAAAFKAVYDKLAAAPVTRTTPTDADLRDYIETMHSIRDLLTAELDRVAAMPDGAELWKSLKSENVFGKAFPIPTDARPAFGRPSPFDRVSEQGKANNKRALLIGGNSAIQALQFDYRVLSKVKDLLSEGFPAKQEAWQKSWEVRANETRDGDVPEAERTGAPQQRFYVYEKGSRWRLAKGVQDGGYATQEQAEAFARSLTARKREVQPPSRGLDLDKTSRTGPDWRQGKDVTAQDIMDRFGFRGVNLGEYVKAKQDVAQIHLNHVYDAFSDLADLMGVPPKAMSLNGTLGVAIGAQGSGKALAHFAPGVNEINITRDSGAGALAHEFGHAMDHYFATQHGRATSMAKRPYLSAVVLGLRENGGVRPEVIDAMKAVMKTINSRPMTEAEARKYMDDQRARNEKYLDRWVKEFSGNRGADVQALQAVAAKIKRGDIGQPNGNDVETNIAEFIRAAGLKPGNSTAANAVMVSYRLRDLSDEAAFLKNHIPQVDTNYTKASDAMDARKSGTEGYWGTPWEKFARAFETFAMDALKDRQRESLYLSGLVDSKGWREWSESTGKQMPFPEGEERLAMQQAFQKLADTIQTREDDAGNVAMFSIADEAPPFYSELARQIEKSPMNAGQPGAWTQYLDALAKRGAVKADEVEWTGLREWLNLQPGKVTKAQIAEYLDANGVQVTETVLGDEARETAAERWMQERAQLEFAMPFDSLDEADQDYIRGKADDANITPERTSKYSNYTLPGGENYREVLLTLPISQAKLDAQRARRNEALNTVPRTPEAQRVLDETRDGGVPKYKSSHWDQPNVLAHIRVNDRTDADGKRVLFVEELQSDWGQEGKKKGFALTANDLIAKPADGNMANRWEVLNKSTGERVAMAMGQNEKEAIQNGLAQSPGVPSAPFVDKTDKWLALSLKRIMKMAVDGGYDRVAFVNGEQSAERYDLSKQIDRVVWMDNSTGGIGLPKLDGEPSRGSLEAYDKNGKQVVRENAIEPERVEEFVGKEVAKRLFEAKPRASQRAGIGMRERALQGVDLKVGGEGMKAFYDKIVPAAVKDVLKKVGGGQMEAVSIATVENGLTVRPVDSPFGKFLVVDGNGKQVGLYETEAEAKAYMAQSAKPQPGFNITDSMRQKVAGGLPLFSAVDAKAKAGDTPADASPVRVNLTQAQRDAIGRLQQAIRTKTGNAAYVLRPVESVAGPGREHAFAVWLAKAGFGATVVPVEQPAKRVFNGAQAGNLMLLDVNTQKPAMAVMGHELLHQLRRDDPSLYSFLKVQMEGVLKASATGDYAAMLRKKYADQDMPELTADAVSEELIADIVGDQFNQRQFWDMLAAKSKNWAVKIARKALEVIDRLLGVDRKRFPYETDKYLTDIEAARKIVADVLAEYSGDKTGAAGGDVKLSAAEKQDQTETAAFRKWFGDSKVVEDGKPKAMYHGTRADFTAFDRKKSASGLFGTGFYFTDDRNMAEEYADGGRVMDVYLSIKNPAPQKVANEVVDRIGEDDADGIRAEFERLGYDGVLMKQYGETLAVAFRPEQIKSATGNQGTFDPDNADIRFSVAATADDIGGLPPGQQTIDEAGAEATRPELPADTLPRRFQRKFQDQYNRFTVIRNWAKEQGMNLSQLSDVWGFEERMHGRMASRIEDFREKRVQPLVEKIQKAGFSMADVGEYLHAQHAKERNDQIQKIDPLNPAGSGMTTADAQAILSEADPKLAALANEFRAITDDTRDTLLQAGIISGDMVKAWGDAYKHYVPLKGGDDATPPTGTGKGLSVKATNKRALGHGERAEFIIENIMRDHERAIMLAEKNLVGHSLLAMVIELGRPDIATFAQPEQRKVLKNRTDYEVVGRNGAVVGTFDSQQAANSFIVTQTRAGLTVRPVKGDPMVSYVSSPMLAENEVQVYAKGQTVRIQLNDPLLARAYKKLGVESLTKMMQINREINGFLSKAYTAYNPEFFVKNVLRDFTSGIINITGEEGAAIAMKAAARYPRAFAEVIRYSYSGKASPSITAYRASGGSTGAAYLGDLERIGADIQASYEEYQGAVQLARNGKPWAAAKTAGRKVVKKLLAVLEHLNAAGENAMRLAVFDTVRNEPGRSIQEAASLAKNSTVNFNRKGEVGAQAGALYLFFNPAVQGTAATLGALFRGKHKHQAQAVAGSLALLAYSLAALQFGGDDEEDEKAWAKIPDHIKDRNLVIRTGEDTHLTLAIPYGYGYFFTLGNVMFDLQRGGDVDRAALKLTSGLVEHFGPAINPIGGEEPDAKGLVELVPGVFGGELMRAGARLLVNRSGLGGEIVPESPFDEGKPDNQLMYRTTRGTGYEKVAATLNQISGGTKSQPGAIDVSPETVKFWTQTITGGAGKFVMDTANTATLMAAKVGETDPDALEALTPDLRETPLVRTIIRKEDIRDARRVYWQFVKEAQEAQKAFSRAERADDMAGMEKIAGDEAYLLGLGESIDKSNKAVKDLRDTIEMINASEDYTRGEKRMLIKDLEKGEQAIYDGMIDLFNDVKKAKP